MTTRRTRTPILHLFEGVGVELEYMLVDRSRLDVRPMADRLLQQAAGRIVNEVSRGRMAWSNELALHVIEIKTDGPAPSLDGLGVRFQDEVNAIGRLLEGHEARLMPGAMHPWMDPHRELRLWPHANNPIYTAYNRIFDCRGHGWANLQSTHLNLPFNGDREFACLHAAVRLILPLIPALAASSPIVDGRCTPWLDYRMEMYRTNALRIPSITGLIVPERVYSRAAYRKQVLEPMYRDIAPLDPDGVLQDEWLNSRGAMSRWDRHAIELRVIDIQEHPAADIAILVWITALARALVDGVWTPPAQQRTAHEAQLHAILMQTIRTGEQAVIDAPDYLAHFGAGPRPLTAGALCRQITAALHAVHPFPPAVHAPLELILDAGPLARRILAALPARLTHRALEHVYRRLCDCLDAGRPFIP